MKDYLAHRWEFRDERTLLSWWVAKAINGTVNLKKTSNLRLRSIDRILE